MDFAPIKRDIAALLPNAKWDDGSLGPLFVRLAWHASGTFDKKTRSGGSDGATMRFRPESSDPANAGLEHARAFLQPLKAKYPSISFADLWTLAGVVAVEAMGGPVIPWSSGRLDIPPKAKGPVDEAALPERIPPNGRLPDAAYVFALVASIHMAMQSYSIDIHALVRIREDESHEDLLQQDIYTPIPLTLLLKIAKDHNTQHTSLTSQSTHIA